MFVPCNVMCTSNTQKSMSFHLPEQQSLLRQYFLSLSTFNLYTISKYLPKARSLYHKYFSTFILPQSTGSLNLGFPFVDIGKTQKNLYDKLGIF